MNTLPPEYTLIGTDSYGRQVYVRNEAHAGTRSRSYDDVQAEFERAVMDAQANYKMAHDESAELEAAIWKERLQIRAKELARESRIESQAPRIRTRNVNARVFNASAPEGRLMHLKREYPTGFL